jgi:hypothetical protein
MPHNLTTPNKIQASQPYSPKQDTYPHQAIYSAGPAQKCPGLLGSVHATHQPTSALTTPQNKTNISPSHILCRSRPELSTGFPTTMNTNTFHMQYTTPGGLPYSPCHVLCGTRPELSRPAGVQAASLWRLLGWRGCRQPCRLQLLLCQVQKHVDHILQPTLCCNTHTQQACVCVSTCVHH